MAAPKGNTYAAGNPGGGRKTVFKKAFLKIAEKMCAMGATDADLAEAFDVSVRTIRSWKFTKEEFSASLKLGKTPANENVKRALYHRAIGYEHEEIDIRVIDGVLTKTPITRYYPPDTAAAYIWLQNREPDEWRTRRDPAAELDAQLKAVELERAKFMLAKLIAGETDTETEDDQAEFFLELSKRLPD